eukprot:SAG31_NODE_36306_length_314_cov_1.204651_1_plen_48_part_10
MSIPRHEQITTAAFARAMTLGWPLVIGGATAGLRLGGDLGCADVATRF